MSKRKRIGELLLEKHLITPEQLQEALKQQQNKGGKIGHILMDTGIIKPEEIMPVLAEQLQVEYVDLRYFEFDPALVKKLPETYARRFRSLVLKDNDVEYVVGTPEPQDLYAYDQLTSQLKRPLTLVLVREKDLLHSIDLLYRRSEEISGFAEELSGSIVDDETKQLFGDDNLSEEDVPVVKLLQSLFKDALQVNASDIHIEPDQNVLRIRQRIDGILHEQVMPEKKIAAALTQRLKLMADLNISERRLPQDGRFNLNIRNCKIDVRLSTLPTQYGESVVMRLLNQSANLLDLDSLGLPADMLQQMRNIFNRPHGMLLVTGPTGSGKTTTLYSVLNEINTADKKIITVEDPVEYRLPRVTQVQVNSKIGLDFSTVLRSTLRQDPDILMVGEIRDRETATIALRAAMTGHLVFATLHTNDAVGSTMRLVDMGAEGYLVAASVNAVLAQRLIRKICESCSAPHTATPQQQAWIDAFSDDKQPKLFRGKGCGYCHHSGYRGRIGVYELLEFDEAMLSALRNNDSEGFVQAAKVNKRFRPLALRALDLARQGITSMDEVLRIAGEVNE